MLLCYCNLLSLNFEFVVEYMRLPASQYSVLDAERIERVSEDTFRCYVYTIKFFTFEVCPVLLVKVEQQPNGCCIKLLSCKVATYQSFINTHVCLFSLSYFLFSYITASGFSYGRRSER